MTENPTSQGATAGLSRRGALSMLAGAAIGGSTPAAEAATRSTPQPIPQLTAQPAPRGFRVRTLTAGTPIQSFADLGAVESALDFLAMAKRIFQAHDYQVQTLRIALNPLLVGATPSARAQALPQLMALDKLVAHHNAVLSIGPVFSLGDSDETIGEWARQLVRQTHATNFSGAVASATHGVHRGAVQMAARVMASLSDAVSGGLANFRFAAAAVVPAGTPFFPVGYHEGSPSLAVGLESANLVRQAFSGAADPNEASERLRALLNSEFAPVEQLARTLAEQSHRRYLGIDSSPAPGRDASIGQALETLTGRPFGAPATLQACAAVTAAIKSLAVATCGYCGLMLPILEDSTLAARAAEGRVSISKLLLYSSVCGTGLDLVPLPGDAAAEDLARIVGDVATLAVRLRKPLSARLFPVPGKKVGDSLGFTDPLLTASRVLPLNT